MSRKPLVEPMVLINKLCMVALDKLQFKKMRLRLVTVVLRYFVYLMVALTLLVSSIGDYRPSYVDRVIAPFKYSFIEWELGHLSDKWVYRLKNSVFKNHTEDRKTALMEVGTYLR